MLKVSAFYLEKQISFIPKKIFFRPLSIKTKKFCLLTQFSAKVLTGTICKSIFGLAQKIWTSQNILEPVEGQGIYDTEY